MQKRPFVRKTSSRNQVLCVSFVQLVKKWPAGLHSLLTLECAGRAKRRRRFGFENARLSRSSKPKRRRRFALPAHSKISQKDLCLDLRERLGQRRKMAIERKITQEYLTEVIPCLAGHQ